ncbi:MAG: tRNA guanosine(34) transglycosylase Tgt [Solirubrobacteraceae bacterium]
MALLEVLRRDPSSRARLGVLHLAHGDVRTPAFVPLATKGVVKGLEASEVAAIGYDMVLGNTFHLFLAPGPELIAELGGLHRFMRWERPIITDSGGFQVFSMGHGTVADEVKGRAPNRTQRSGEILDIAEEGVRFRSYVDGAQRFMAPETSMEVQAALGSDVALAFDECTPFHVPRDYTATSTERTHRWLRRCLDWHASNGPDGQIVYGIVQGGVHEDLRRASAQEVAASGCDGIAVGGSLGREKAQMYEVVEWAVAELPTERPRHLLGIGDVDDLLRGVELGIDTFDCAMPTRLGRHGVAVIPDPATRWRVDLTASSWKRSDEPIMDGCPCPACSQAYSRSYLRYLFGQRELTALRLVTLHNLAFLARLMERLRSAIAEDRLSEETAALRAGAAP